jgi:uncharacterized protein
VILEGIVTTLGPDGEVNVAPMGPHLPDLFTSMDFPRRDPLTSFVLKPFRSSRTYLNLDAHPEGVLHVTDDVLLLAQAAVGTPDPMPALMPATQVRGVVLRDACRYAEFRVASREERGERVTFAVEVLHVGRLRDFFGFNRAMFAVVEAAILATRLAFLPVEQIDSEYQRLAVLVEKTGGPREHQAFALLKAHVEAHRRGGPR